MPTLTSPARRRTRSLLVTIVLALLLAACAPWTPGGRGGMPHDGMPMDGMHGSARSAGDNRAPAPVEDAVEAHVQATDMAFTPDQLDLVAGETVNVTVTNDGQLFHDFTLEEAGIHLNLKAGQQATAALTLDEPGTYDAICTVAGHAAAGMVLTIDVTPA